MRYLLLILIAKKCLLFAKAQTDFYVKEKELIILIDSIRKAQNEEEKILLSDALALELETILSDEKSLLHPFDSLKLISKIIAPDKTWRMFNWHIEDDKKQHRYWAIIQYKHQNKYRVLSLTDVAEDIKNPESKTLKGPQWYGAHYFQVFMPDKNTYVLFGYNGKNNLISQKIIEILYFDNKGNIVFGNDVFLTPKGNFKRIIFEYSREVSMSLKYYEKNKIIVFDHLAPREPHLVNSKQFYGPDLSYDAYEYKNGKWHLIENIDVSKFVSNNKKVKYNTPE